MSNEEKKLNEEERSQNSVTASVSADHDYNGQNSEINGNILKVGKLLINCMLIIIIQIVYDLSDAYL